MTMGNAIGVALSQVRKSVGGLTVFHGVDLDVEARGVRGLRGPFGLRKVHTPADDRRP